MAEKVLMLALSPTMEEGTIAGWKKKEGDAITQGEVICEVETDKATMDYESVQEGTLLKILVDAGEDAAVGLPIAIVGEKGEDISDLVKEASDELKGKGSPEPEEKKPETKDEKPGEGEKGGPEPAKKAEAAEKEPQEPVKSPDSRSAPAAKGQKPAAAADGWVKASPLARELARQRGIELSNLEGSGPEGRIVRRDIEAAAKEPARGFGRTSAAASAAASTPAGEDRSFKVTKMRKAIAARLAESKFSAPHFYLTVPVRGEALLDSRARINKQLDDKVSVNAFLMKLAAEALKRHPRVNAGWEEDTIREFGSIDVGLAVALEDGLITPIVRNCGGKGILAIDQELKELIPRAQTGRLSPEEYTGATFSISNLGSFGIEEFTAIINPPGSAILAVGALASIPVVEEDNTLGVGKVMKMTLSCDHRVVDGALGARFMETLKGNFENPMSALL